MADVKFACNSNIPLPELTMDRELIVKQAHEEASRRLYLPWLIFRRYPYIRNTLVRWPCFGFARNPDIVMLAEYFEHMDTFGR
jgi:hypothetical protein